MKNDTDPIDRVRHWQKHRPPTAWGMHADPFIADLVAEIRRLRKCQHHDDAGGVPSADDRQERSRKPASDGCTLFDGVRVAEGRDG